MNKNATDDKGFTAVCKHPMCDWHSGNASRHAMRHFAKQHIRDTGMTHSVAIYASAMNVRGEIYVQSGQVKDVRSSGTRAVLETVHPINPYSLGAAHGVEFEDLVELGPLNRS